MTVDGFSTGRWIRFVSDISSHEKVWCFLVASIKCIISRGAGRARPGMHTEPLRAMGSPVNLWDSRLQYGENIFSLM